MLKLQIKRFEFQADNRLLFDLSGGLRISELDYLEVPKVANLYSVATDLTAKTWTTTPQKMTRVVGVQIDRTSVPEPATYELRFRIWDGSGELWWDGAAWSAPDVGEWNTEAELVTNIPAYTGGTLGFTINAWTLTNQSTPKIKTIRVLYEVDISELQDLIYGSVVPELEALRPRSVVAYQIPANGTTTLDFSDPKALGIETPYNLQEVTKVYLYNADEALLHDKTDLLTDFDLGTKIATFTALDIGDVAWVEFTYKPTVAVQTSRDYNEIAALPVIELHNIETRKVNSQIATVDVVFNLDNEGWKVPGPRIEDVTFQLQVVTDKQRDLYEFIEQLAGAGFAAKHYITMRGTDESYATITTSYFDDRSRPHPSDLRRYAMNVEILRVPFYNLPAEQVTGLSGIEFNFGDTILVIPQD